MPNIQIIVGTVLGTAEQVGRRLTHCFANAGHLTELNLQPSLDSLMRDPEEIIIFCCSTTGAGDLPKSITPLYQQLITEFPRIAGRRYGFIALGDSTYPSFAHGGIDLDNALSDIGALRIGELTIFDDQIIDDYSAAADTWATQFLQQL